MAARVSMGTMAAVVLSACHDPAPAAKTPDDPHSSRASSEVAAAPPKPTGPIRSLADAPVLVDGMRIELDASWLPNGHLVTSTPHAKIEIDPERPEDRWKRVTMPRKIRGMVSADGGRRLLTMDDRELTLWNGAGALDDAAHLAPVRRWPVPAADPNLPIAGFQDRDFGHTLPMALSGDGTRAAYLAPLERKLHVLDADGGAEIAVLDVRRVGHHVQDDESAPGDVAEPDDATPHAITLSDDGTLAITTWDDLAVARDVASGRVVLSRKWRCIDSRGLGTSEEICVARHGRIVVTSRSDGRYAFRTSSDDLEIRKADHEPVARVGTDESVSLQIFAGVARVSGPQRPDVVFTHATAAETPARVAPTPGRQTKDDETVLADASILRRAVPQSRRTGSGSPTTARTSCRMRSTARGSSTRPLIFCTFLR